MKDYHEWELNLPEMWFTGEEWANGYAQKAYGELYRERSAELDAEAELRRKNDAANPELGKQYVERFDNE